MSRTTCKNCGAVVKRRWEEAFDKFGYDDGDGEIGTSGVVAVLEAAGYRCTIFSWHLHNPEIIKSIKDCNGKELIGPSVNRGYDDPRDYLSVEIVGLLDRALPELGEV